MAITLGRLFLVYLLIPSAFALCTMLLKTAQPALFMGVLLFLSFWFLLISQKSTERAKRWDLSIAIHLLASATVVIIVFTTVTREASGIPRELFEAGLFSLNLILVIGVAEFERQEIPKIGCAGAAAILYGWTSLCAAPIVKYFEEAPRSMHESPTWVIPIAQAITFFMVGTVCLLVGFATAGKNNKS